MHISNIPLCNINDGYYLTTTFSTIIYFTLLSVSPSLSKKARTGLEAWLEMSVSFRFFFAPIDTSQRHVVDSLGDTHINVGDTGAVSAP